MKTTAKNLQELGCINVDFFYVVLFHNDKVELDTASRSLHSCLCRLRELFGTTTKAKVIRFADMASWSEAIVSDNGRRVLNWR